MLSPSSPSCLKIIPILSLPALHPHLLQGARSEVVPPLDGLPRHLRPSLHHHGASPLWSPGDIQRVFSLFIFIFTSSFYKISLSLSLVANLFMYASVSLSTAARNYIITALPVPYCRLQNYIITSIPRQNIIIAIIIMNLILN